MDNFEEDVSPPQRNDLAAGTYTGAAAASLVTDVEALCAAEVARYMADGLYNMPPLQFWHTNALRYELLARLAKQYLCICASSVPCERLFSSAGFVYSDRRASLSPENVR